VIVEAPATSSITFTGPAAVFTLRTAMEDRPVIWIACELRTATSDPAAGSAARVGTGLGVADGVGEGLAPGFAVPDADGLGVGVPVGLGLGLAGDAGVALGPAVGPGAAVGVGPAADAGCPGVAVGLGDGLGLGCVQHHQNQIGHHSMLTPVLGWPAAKADWVVRPMAATASTTATHRLIDDLLIDLSLS